MAGQVVKPEQPVDRDLKRIRQNGQLEVGNYPQTRLHSTDRHLLNL